MTTRHTVPGLVLALASILTSACTTDFPAPSALTTPGVLEQEDAGAHAANPVRAFFRYDCVATTCQFTDESTVRSGAPIGSWLWAFGDGGTSTDQNPSHTYAAAGKFLVTLTATNDLGSDDHTRRVRVSDQSR